MNKHYSALILTLDNLFSCKYQDHYCKNTFHSKLDRSFLNSCLQHWLVCLGGGAKWLCRQSRFDYSWKLVIVSIRCFFYLMMLNLKHLGLEPGVARVSWFLLGNRAVWDKVWRSYFPWLILKKIRMSESGLGQESNRFKQEIDQLE